MRSARTRALRILQKRGICSTPKNPGRTSVGATDCIFEDLESVDRERHHRGIMSTKVIVEKLRRELNEEITTERQVVYLLAQIRKLLEAEGEKPNLADLWFHCSWPFHSRLKLKPAKEVVEDFRAAHVEALESNSRLMADLSPDVATRIKHRMLYGRFRPELETLLRTHKLPDYITSSAKHFGDFLSLYTDAIAGAALQISGVRKGGSSPENVTLTVEKKREEDVVAIPNQVGLFGTRWVVQFDDGPQYCWTVDFHVDPNGVPPPLENR